MGLELEKYEKYDGNSLERVKCIVIVTVARCVSQFG